MSAPETCDYVVIGSGAGGGTVAARLAEAGQRVVLLEAGGDPMAGASPGLPEQYEVPAFHALASENPAIAWHYFVRHYADQVRQRRDPKYLAEWRGRPVDGVLYPRASALGGCTAHNAMIFITPPDEDWDAIAALTGDASWQASAMQAHYRAIENCHHRPEWRLLSAAGIDPTGHGWHGWLRTERAMPSAAFHDDALLGTVIRSAFAAIRDADQPIEELWALLEGRADPNDRRLVGRDAEGICYTPLTTQEGMRTGTRERVLDVAGSHPDRLRVELDALATRIVLDETCRAVAVEYRSGANLFRAHAQPATAPGEARVIRPAKEVILACGAFNTPHLLMLSGIGPPEALRRHGIAPRVDLPGVGQNLQDRYEISVVNRMAQPWSSLDGARFDREDALFRQWWTHRRGMYASNGTAFAVARRSTPDKTLPDLFCMALLARFQGYFPGYSRLIAEHHDTLSWTILKGHTGNRAGTVSLRSADPRDPPLVTFNAFEQEGAEDAQAVVEGIRFARRMTEGLVQAGLVLQEDLPGGSVVSDADLVQFVRDNAWGHHASCSCPIGARAQGGVVDSALRVHGVTGLRIADASIFPRIPGFFIASAVYMVGEKAAQTILKTATP